MTSTITFTDPILEDALEELYGILAEFTTPQSFLPCLEDGEQPLAQGSCLFEQLKQNQFQDFPEVEIVPQTQLQGKNADYVDHTNTIYVSSDFLSQYLGEIPRLKAMVEQKLKDYLASRLKGINLA